MGGGEREGERERDVFLSSFEGGKRGREKGIERDREKREREMC